jgi:uncharacterized membrane protein
MGIFEKKKFFSDAESEAIVEAINNAELVTAAEIRVHVESHCKGDELERAVEVFYRLEMDKTTNQNGVLIYVAFDDHKLAIVGDKGANDVLPEGFWSSEIELMKFHFSKNEFAEGFKKAIAELGEKLKAYYPASESGNNELSNEISEGNI